MSTTISLYADPVALLPCEVVAITDNLSVVIVIVHTYTPPINP